MASQSRTIAESVATITPNRKLLMAKRQKAKPQNGPDYLSYSLLFLVVLISIVTFPEDWSKSVAISHVWFYGWVTAVSTGAGVLPFYFIDVPDKYYMGICNAIAAGMMLAASFSLACEGVEFADDLFDVKTAESQIRTALGFVIGFVFIIGTKKILENFERLRLGDVEGTGAQKMVLILFVMTLHSLSEGIGIGVSFGGKRGMQLGQFISLSLAMHNVPEGLAVALVMTSRKVSKLRSGLWAIFTSLPQPIFAIPAFLFVGKFIQFLPAGLGFAAGAMTYVALFELLLEACEDTSAIAAIGVASVSSLLMLVLQHAVRISM